ncbi:MAG: hypothetical protein CVT99_03005 [Bacteroidetes bacterium HGW-Bacteroidetes-16]|jgi:uncharacterized membrane protein|nr:MAG: hypothetical protein CVT99_03005 [Bacteroidetes bacterium HGW-Bacteroidetes-16]
MTQKKLVQEELEKDSPYRSLFKAISWRFIASGATFIISFTVFTQATQSAFKDVIGAVSMITAIDIIAKLILYYLHERLWTNIGWGKYWHRQVLRKRYKSIHKKRPEKS